MSAGHASVRSFVHKQPTRQPLQPPPPFNHTAPPPPRPHLYLYLYLYLHLSLSLSLVLTLSLFILLLGTPVHAQGESWGDFWVERSGDAQTDMGRADGLRLSSPMTDTVPPQIAATFPAADAVGVSASVAPLFEDEAGGVYAPVISVDFTEALSETTVSSATVRLTDGAGAPVSVTIELAEAGMRVLVLPRQTLPAGRYTVTVAGGISDVAGNPLAGAQVWGFETVAAVYHQVYLPMTPYPAISCSDITEIPRAECDALWAIKNANDSEEADLFQTWFRSPSPCRWTDVTCHQGHVTGLELNKYGMRVVPPEMGDLAYLARLNMRGNNLTSLPTEMKNLVRLEFLSISGNQMEEIPSVIYSIPTLKYLLLYENRFTRLSPQIGNLSNLLDLHLHVNQFDALPGEIGQLVRLEKLYLDDNRLTHLPVELFALSALQHLELSNNQLTELPSQIDQLTNLTGLYLDDNQITSIPSSISNIPNLSGLSVNNNRLSAVPADLYTLQELTYLGLGGNQLTVLSPDLFNLTKLQGLDLSDNQFTALPAEIGNLSDLRRLYLSDNQFASLPNELFGLSELELLNLAGNQLVTLSPQVGNLRDLTILDLSKNQLTTLPGELGVLTYLINLYASGNQLASLSADLGNSPYLRVLTVHDNPLTGELPELLTHLGLNKFSYYDTGWCVPASGTVADWHASKSDYIEGTGQVCGRSPGSLAGTVSITSAGSVSGTQVVLRRVLWDETGEPSKWITVTQTTVNETGTYRFDDLGQDIDYRVQFVDPSGLYAAQWYDRVADPTLSTPIAVTLGAVRTGVDGVLHLAR